MWVHNVHERILHAPASAAGPLLDDLGGPHDALWPSPEWAPMWLEGPPAVGVTGGHAKLRYRVSAYEPGRRIVFTLEPNVLLGMDAGHLDFRAVVSVEPERVVLTTLVRRHNRRGRAYFALVRRIHPVVVAAMLTRAATRLSRRPAAAVPVR
jgi:hypothetical protein